MTSEVSCWKQLNGLSNPPALRLARLVPGPLPAEPDSATPQEVSRAVIVAVHGMAPLFAPGHTVTIADTATGTRLPLSRRE
jgi:hypothetical protein